MYAIVRTGGKQYQVSQGDKLRVEKINGQVGDTIELEDVLMVVDGENTHIGTPSLDKASVKATIVEQGKSKKIIVFKKKRRKGYRLKQGHRQPYTSIAIDEIMK